MSSNSIITSGDGEKRWVLAMEKNFPQHQILTIDFNSPLCVMRVPKTLSQDKPEAYAPRRLGLGPLHHLRPDLYAMHNHKLAAITQFLPPHKLQNFHLAIEALVPLEPLVRACYDQYLDLDIATLAWIFAIDGVFLLHFLKNYPEMKHLAGDVLMLENQIPLVLLHKIRHILELDLTPDHDPYLAFLEDQSPLELDTNGADASTSSDAHLLHRMYHLIVSSRRVRRGLAKKASPFTRLSAGFAGIQVDGISQSVQILDDLGLPGAGTARQILSFANKIPWGKITAMFKKNEGTPTAEEIDMKNEGTPTAEEIDIPSVSQMTKIAKIRFIKRRGIRDIRFDDEEKKLYLPSIRVSGTSEIVLRNLVAYEAATAQAGASLEVAEYVDLMCGMIDSGKDVEILREERIVESELDDEEIAVIFNGISKSEKKKKKGDDKTKVEEAIESMNRGYSSLVRVKVENFVYASFKFMSVVITIAVLLLLTLQAFCSVFGCSRWFDKTDAIATMLSF